MQPPRSIINHVKCIVVDFAFTLCSEKYFKVVPSAVPDWQNLFQTHIFADKPLVDQWIAGEISAQDIAEIMTRYINMTGKEIAETMELGCRNLVFNKAVFQFVKDCKKRGQKVALVTANMDVFSKIVVPAHHLEKYFDLILNTSDYHEPDKRKLWPICFAKLGDGIGFHNSLLIEDGEKHPTSFRASGGFAFQYTDDEAFEKWLQGV